MYRMPLFFLAVSLLTADMAASLAGKSTEQAMKALCDGRVVGENTTVDKACSALGCGIYDYPCSSSAKKAAKS